MTGRDNAGSPGISLAYLLVIVNVLIEVERQQVMGTGMEQQRSVDLKVQADALGRLFRPRSVAIIGASDKNPWSRFVHAGLENIGFTGELNLVNVRGSPALGRETVTSCVGLGDVDAAFIAVPAPFVEAAIEDMAAGGIKCGAIVSSGFAETGREGAVLEARVVARARALGLTLLGPNSLGFSNFIDRVSLAATPITAPVLPTPRVGLVSQSGATAAMISAVAHRQNVSLSYAITTGNEAMVDLSQVIHFLIEDANTKAVAVFAETIRNPAAFREAARAAHAARKAIVMLKVGTGQITAAVAQAHTGALVGDDRIFQAVCDEFGILRVTSIEDLVVTADLLAAVGPVDALRGFALISISGGACEIVADQGEALGVAFPLFAAATREKLAQIGSAFATAHNPLDITGAALGDASIYTGSIKAIAGDPNVGLIGVLGEIPSEDEPGSVVAAAALKVIAEACQAATVPSVVIQQTLKPIDAAGRKAIATLGLTAVSGGLDHAVRGVARLYTWSKALARPLPRLGMPPFAAKVRPASERATLDYLAGAGVPVIPQHVVTTRGMAQQTARELSGEVVLKISSPDIQHKSDIGGVALGLSGDEAVGDAFDRIMASVQAAKPSARVDGIVISPMRAPAVELFVGIARDPAWGLAMALGLGGMWVELLDDTALKVLPVTPADVELMLTRLRGFKVLRGYRGSEPADLDCLCSVIARIGDAAMALGDDLEALEINPLRVKGVAVEALDALAIWHPS